MSILTPGLSPGEVSLARIEVDRVCELLEAPTVQQLDSCALVLADAIKHLKRLHETPGARANAVEANRLRRSVHTAKTLLQLAGRHQARWQRMLEAMCGCYGASGAPEELRFQPRICAQG